MNKKVLLNLLNLAGISIGLYMSQFMDYSMSYQRTGQGIFLYFSIAFIISIVFTFTKIYTYKKIFKNSLIFGIISLLLIILSPETGDPYLPIQKNTVALFLVMILFLISLITSIYNSNEFKK